MRLTMAVGLPCLLISGCSPDGGVVAKVGSRTITVADFKDAARGAEARYLVPPDSAKGMLLGDLIRRALMLERAQQSGLIRDSLVRIYRQNVETQLLSNALVAQMAPRMIPVSEAEVRQLYQWRDTVAHMQVIYTPDLRMAEAALTALKGGEDFVQVSNRFSLPGVLPAGGDLGFLQPGSLVNPLDLYLRTAPLGRVIGPIQAPGEGWFILRIRERKRQEQPPFELQGATLEAMIRQRKQRTLLVRAFQDLRDVYRLKVEPGAAQLLYARYNSPLAGIGGQTIPPPPRPQDLTQVLARYDAGGEYHGVFTFADALNDLERGEGERPNPTLLPAFQQWIESQAMRRIVVMEARRRHLDENPEIAKGIRERVNNYVVESIYDADVISRAEPSPQDLHAAYERQRPSLARLDEVEIQYLTVPDSAAAERVIEHARSAATIKEAVLLASPGLDLRQEQVRYPTPDPTWNSLRLIFAQTPDKDYVRPFRVANGWRVVQVISKKEFVPSFEELDQAQQQMVRSEAIELAREKRLAQYTDSLRHALPIQVNRERLRWVPWPVPPPGTSIG